MNKIKFSKIVFLMFFFFSLVVGIGGLLNSLVMSVNKDKMPVYYPHDFENEKHFSYQDKKEINLSYFSDFINTSKSIYSVGDLIIIGGSIFAFIFAIIWFYLLVFCKIKKEEFYF